MVSITERVSDETEGWRLEQLLGAGFQECDAWLLAADRDVDLHKALDLLRSGCPAELALLILL